MEERHHPNPLQQEVDEVPPQMPSEFIQESLDLQVHDIIPTNRGEPEVYGVLPPTVEPETPQIIVEPVSREVELTLGDEGNDKKRKPHVALGQPHDKNPNDRVKMGSSITMVATEKGAYFHLKAFLVNKLSCPMSPFIEESVGPHPNPLQREVHEAQPLTPSKFIQDSLVHHIIVEPINRGEPEVHEALPLNLEPETPCIIVKPPNRGVELTLGDEGNERKRKAPVALDESHGKNPQDSGARKLAAGKKRRRKSLPQKVKILDTPKGSQLKQLDARDDTRIEIEHSTDTVDLSTIVNSLSFPSRHEGSPATLYRVSNAGDSVGDQQERLVDKSSTQGCSNLHSPLNETESTLACPTTGKSPSKEPCLPFEKHSAMWAFVESMELISRMRQQPHFLPLEQHSEVFREGMAISLMVTYSTMMNSIPRLKIANSRLKFFEYMNTLMHLEGHGFEIQHIRTRLEKLLRMKNDWEQLVEKSSSLEVLMLDKEQERDKLNGEIERIDEVIEYLKRSLVVLNERSTSMLKQHEENDAHIAELKMEARVVEEGMQSAECEFKRIVDSACCCS